MPGQGFLVSGQEKTSLPGRISKEEKRVEMKKVGTCRFWPRLPARENSHRREAVKKMTGAQAKTAALLKAHHLKSREFSRAAADTREKPKRCTSHQRREKKRHSCFIIFFPHDCKDRKKKPCCNPPVAVAQSGNAKICLLFLEFTPACLRGLFKIRCNKKTKLGVDERALFLFISLTSPPTFTAR